MKIFLIRHGETEWSRDDKHTGLTDIPLTENGREQAKKLGQRLKGHVFKRVFTSPLKRAEETCRLSGFGAHVEINRDLVEWNYGDYEGRKTVDILKENPGWSLFLHGAPAGESVAEVSLRADRVIEKIQTVHGDVAIFSSGHFLRMLAVRWIELVPSTGRLLLLSTASISVLGYERETRVIARWNDTAVL